MNSTAVQSRSSATLSTRRSASSAVLPTQSADEQLSETERRAQSFVISNAKIHPLTAFLWVCLALALAYPFYRYSMHLAGSRIYQVDECQNIFAARVLATGSVGKEYTNLSLIQLPLAWLARNATRSVDLFASARLISLLIFWLNVVLLAAATGARLISRKGLLALIGAATLAPVWDYGFEFRHDNLLLTGLLLTWCAVRVHPARTPSYCVAGALAVIMQFTAFKAFVYTVPLSIAILVFPPTGSSVPRWKLALAWAMGALGMFLLFRIAYGAAGLWDLFLSNHERVTTNATGANRFAPWKTLGRLLFQTPLLSALALAGLFALVLDCGRRRREALSWQGVLPEALLFLVAFAALIINPTPFPYNLLNLVPFAFLFAFRHVSALSMTIWRNPDFRPVVVNVVLFAHLIPFVLSTRRHADHPNYRQEKLMRMAESLTDPATDPVYDGIGLVPSRPSIGFHWFLHSFNIQSFTHGSGPHVRDLLAEQPPAVIIPNYRTDWLPEEDHEFIRNRYVALGDDFWVLGDVLPSGGGTFTIYHPGRYRISHLQGSGLLGTYPETLAEKMKAAQSPRVEPQLTAALNGVPVGSEPIKLEPGTYQLAATSEGEVAVVWVGPRLDRLPELGRGDHRRLFVNWY